MNKPSDLLIILGLVATLLINACKLPANKNTEKELSSEASTSPTVDFQIGNYIVEIFQDSKGVLWFGTLSKGVARFDGVSLTYLSTDHGLIGNSVVSIVEDHAGNLWFGTHSGLSKYDGKTFKNYTIHDELCHSRISQVFIDSKKTMWIGTWGGVCRFDGENFSSFSLPKAEIEIPDYHGSEDWVTEIMEDKSGNIWFGRDGFGATKFDGQSFTHFSKQDGLPSNNVQEILEDNMGNIWIGSRVAERDHPDEDKRKGAGGLSLYDGNSFRQFPEYKGLSDNDIYSLYQDRQGNIWIGTTMHGVYKYDGKDLTNYHLKSSNPAIPAFKGIQSMWEDRSGKLWLGCSGGLFRLDGENITNVSQYGPWN